MDDERRLYVEEFGILFERLGGARMLGRVLGMLFVSDPPEVTAEQLATELHASRGSISQATRLLIQIGMIQRINKPGVRADFYKVRREAWVESSRQRQGDIVALLEISRRGAALMEGRSEESQASLRHSIEFLTFWLDEFQSILDRWLDRVKERTERSS